MVGKTIRELLVLFELATSLIQADDLCRLGSVRLNGQICSNAYLVPRVNDTVSVIGSDYTYQVGE